MTFYEYITSNYENSNTPVGDLARDMLGDDTFPKNETRLFHLLVYMAKVKACPEAITALEEAYEDYEDNALIYTDTGNNTFDPLEMMYEAVCEQHEAWLDGHDSEYLFDALKETAISAALLREAHAQYGGNRC